MRLCTPFNMHPTKPFDRKSGDGQFDGLDRYQDLLTSHFKTMDRSLWDNLIKFHWLWRKFGYRWESYEKGDGSKKLNVAWAIFLRHYVGAEKTLYYQESTMALIKSYAGELYPNLLKGNPFEEKFDYPFPNLLMCHLATVREVDERVALLKYADEKKMRYNDFLDFIANWVACYNDKYGPKYQMQINKAHLTAAVVNLTKQDGFNRPNMKWLGDLNIKIDESKDGKIYERGKFTKGSLMHS